MKKINKSSLSALLIIFGFFVMTLNFWENPATSKPIFTEDGETNELLPNTSQFIPRTIRVAIYNEPNTTAPSYAAGGGPALDNNYTGVMQLLQGAGYQVDELTCDDIYNHKLMTADYDVFVMVDNLPKTNITDYVKEFWLGGGAILSFDSAILYLCYYGIFIPESVGDHGWGTYYAYVSDNSHNISSRHPSTKDYKVNDKFSSTSTHSAYLYWDILQGTSVGAEVVKLANRDGINNDASAVALERDDKGGRIVQLPGRGNEIGTNMSDLIIDAVEWLCPRPKGRILFDLSHHPFYGMDSWDDVQSSTNYGIWRDNLVNRSYTIDKLYPSATGNLTTSNLLPYDMLFLCMPEYNFTANEVTAVTQWVDDGGGLIAIGEHAGFADENNNINYLYGSYDLQMVSVTGTSGATYIVEHPTVEGCTEISASSPGTIDYSGDAFPIWGYDDTEIYVAGQEYGNGRVILMSDVGPFRDADINDLDNLQYAINVANWLTASQAKVLIYVDENTGPTDPNDNLYRGPVATALNDLGLPFYLTFTRDYFNLSLHEETWNLIVIDNTYYNFFGDADLNEDIISYVENGGFLIMSTWYYRFSVGNKLWDYCGFEYEGHYFTTPPTIHIWDNAHRVFNNPALYSVDNINSTWNYVNTECTNLTLHNNASAIAGLTNTVSSEGAAIIIGANGRVLTNAMITTVYYDDTDDSTYPDALEIWENEIAFMAYQSLSVGINSPHTSDIFNATSPDFIITTAGMFLDDIWYTLNSGAEYHITSTSGALNLGAWDGLPDGDVSLKFYVEDSIGNQKYTGVNIVKDSQGPNITITSPSAGDTFGATALSFIVEIVDEHLDKMWYTINSGSTKYFFTANGSIDQSAWDALADGSITIQFYANDTVSNEAFATISVELSTGGNGGPGIIPGYNSYILIGVIFVISAIIIKRQIKQNKLKN